MDRRRTRSSSPVTGQRVLWRAGATGTRRRRTDRRTSRRGRPRTAASAAARRAASHEDRLDGADALELRADAVAACDGELPRERAGHDVIAGLQSPAIRRQLSCQPRHGAERMSEHGIAPAGADLRAVDADARADAREVERLTQRYRRPDHEELLLRVVGQRQRELACEVAARLDDLQRRMTALDGARDIVDPELGADEIAVQHDADFVLEAGGDQIVVAEAMTGLDAALAQQAAEHRLVNVELLLDRLGGEANLPAGVGDAGRAAAAHERQLNPVRVVEVEPVTPFGWKVNAALAGSPEVLDRILERSGIEGHRISSGGSRTTRLGSTVRSTTLPTFGADGRRALSTAPDSSAISTSYSRPWYSTRRTVPRAPAAPLASSTTLRSSGRMAASTALPSARLPRPRSLSPPPSAVSNPSAPRPLTVSGSRLR